MQECTERCDPKSLTQPNVILSKPILFPWPLHCVSYEQVAGEQKYHPECFTCVSCEMFIGDGDTYTLVERSKLYW